MTDVLVREVATGLQVRDGGDGRTLVGPLLPWGVEARVFDRGRLVVEVFERGALADADPARVPLTARHPVDNQQLPIGLTLSIDERADAAWGEWRVSKTAAGDEILELARDGVPLGLSIGFREVVGGSRWSLDRRSVTRTRATLLDRYRAHELGIKAGWLLRSEVRELEDRPPIAGIDDQDPPQGVVA